MTRMSHCGCGNVAKLGSTMCGRCQGEKDHRDQLSAEHADLLMRVDGMKNTDELRDLLRDIIGKVYE